MTEKDYNPEQRNKKAMDNPKVVGKVNEAPMQKTAPKEGVPSREGKKKITEPQSDSENKESINKKDSEISKVESKETKVEAKKPVKKEEPKKQKKEEAIVKGVSLPLSTKTTTAVCKFIKGKYIPKAIADLEQVIVKKKAVPMKGEIPHRKGKIMSGRFPKKTSEYFIRLLKDLQANSNANGLDEPVIVEAMANIASQPYGKFGRVRKKRSHVLIKAKEKVKKKGVTPQASPDKSSTKISTGGKK